MRKRNAEFFLAMAQGAIIGVAGIIPGASGGVLAVSMGVYRSIVNAVLSLLKDFRKNFLYLLPFGLGGVAGILLTARGLAFLLANHRGALMYALMGMVLGGCLLYTSSARRSAALSSHMANRIHVPPLFQGLSAGFLPRSPGRRFRHGGALSRFHKRPFSQ